MSRFHGAMGKGFAKILRELKREEAEQRNARTPSGRRKAVRKGRADA